MNATFNLSVDIFPMKNELGFEDLLPMFEKAIQMAVEAEVTKRLSKMNNVKKLYYSLKEVSEITGLTILAIKGRYRRETLDVVYEGSTPLIPTDELERLLQKLDEQRKSA